MGGGDGEHRINRPRPNTCSGKVSQIFAFSDVFFRFYCFIEMLLWLIVSPLPLLTVGHNCAIFAAADWAGIKCVFIASLGEGWAEY